MFLSTSQLNRRHAVLGIIDATTSTMLTSERPDQFELFDGLFDEAKARLMAKAAQLGADGVVDVRFNTEIAQMTVAPKFLVVHGYGTAVKVPDTPENVKKSK